MSDEDERRLVPRERGLTENHELCATCHNRAPVEDASQCAAPRLLTSWPTPVLHGCGTAS